MKFPLVIIFMFITISLLSGSMPLHQKQVERGPSSIVTISDNCLGQFSLFMESHSQFSKDQFDLAFQNVSRWKKSLIYSLWKDEINANRFVMRREGRGLFEKLTIEKISRELPLKEISSEKISLPMFLSLPLETVKIIKMTLKQERVRGDHFLILPTKMVVTKAVDAPFLTTYLVLGFGPLGALLSVTGLSLADPLVDNAETTAFQDDEILLIFKLDDSKIQDYNAASYIGSKIIAKLQRNDPKHIRVIDLSQTTSVYDLYNRHFLKEMNVLIGDKKVKRVIVSSHGSPNMIYTKDGAFSLREFGTFLRSLNLTYSENAAIFFNGCNVVATKEAQHELSEVGRTTLGTHGGTITANITYGVSGYSFDKPYDFNNITDSVFDTLFWIDPKLHFMTSSFSLVINKLRTSMSNEDLSLLLQGTQFSKKIDAGSYNKKEEEKKEIEIRNLLYPYMRGLPLSH